MINEVLDMSKIEANAMKIVKSAFWISRAVNEVCNILKPLALKKNINLNLNMEVDFEVFAVLSDADSDLSADVHAKSEVTDSVRSKRSAVIRFFIRSSR